MTYDGRTKEEKERDRQRDHEMRLALINAFAKDPELKYYVGVAVGAGVAGIASVFASATEGVSGGGGVEGGDPSQWESTGSAFEPWRRKGEAEPKESWAWVVPAAFILAPGAAASNVGLAVIAGWLTGTDEGKEAAKELGWPSTVGGILTLGATGFAGFCASILILKAMFGEKGAGSILSTITGAVV